MPVSPPDRAEDLAEARAQAEHATRVVADRLTDADAVVATAATDGTRGSWRRFSLLEGYPGVAMLFAELGHHDDRYTKVSRRYLEAAREQLEATTDDGLFDGLAAIAFTARAASRSPAEYERLLTSLEQHVIARTNALVFTEHKRTTAGRAGADPRTYDLRSGLTGLGAYLLTAHRHSLADVLTALVALTEPVTVDGHRLPGWWVRSGQGHLDLGMAHGVAGTLALLALAWRAGVRVTGQEQAMRRVAEWFVAKTHTDGVGPGWPGILTTADELTGPRGTGAVATAWCHGTPGVARALQLAGMELHVPAWRDMAVSALGTMLDRIPAPAADAAVDASLCHGWSGVLHVTRRMAEDSGDERLTAHAHGLARRVLDAFDPALPFGFRHPTDPRDRAGFLDGAAGIALALHAYARDAAPASGWDRALLAA